ncbi:MAG: hypothetical protein LBC27_00515 [Spirochaetaceae bacterium]|jgi:DNA repair exonuclease SbcCD ATPase subunit|nr:hypothetical protein [Spirochaetaceae bacterium]
MNGKIPVAAALTLTAFIVGLLAGYFWGSRINRIRHGAELESVRAEQQRTNDEYIKLRDNYTRERELNNRIRTIIAGSTGLLQSNDKSISGLKSQLSELREKIQELKTLFDSVGSGGSADGRGPNMDDSQIDGGL